MLGELPNGVPQNLIPYLTQTAIGIREKLSVFGDDYDTPDGSCIRDFINVVDLAKAHVVAIRRILENKQKFIGQLMSSKNPSRTCEDVDAAALSYAEVKALASGDPRIIEYTELDAQVTKLKLVKANFESQKYALEDKLLKFFPQSILREQEFIRALTEDSEHLQEHTPIEFP